MNDLGVKLLGMQPILAAIISAVFFILLLMDKDELEQYAFNSALKISALVTIIFLLGYGFFMLMIGQTEISINAIFYAVEGLGALTIILYFIRLREIEFVIKIKNEKIANTLLYISIIISVLATISMLFEFEFFNNEIGYIRFDELAILINVILLGLVIPLLPKRKKLSRQEYKKMKREIDKKFNIIYLIYGVLMLLFIIYIFNQKVMM
ncbi:hypothetical protein [Abyssisolibacter fermentans]|uniref:hypothetical protein n=1 Tax=Abyssisolibacter fermentans TaxID=1766203 RepID=UPI000832752D|nr:hypothetical protein [Abyssisolibacter fermentans]